MRCVLMLACRVMYHFALQVLQKKTPISPIRLLKLKLEETSVKIDVYGGYEQISIRIIYCA